MRPSFKKSGRAFVVTICELVVLFVCMMMSLGMLQLISWAHPNAKFGHMLTMYAQWLIAAAFTALMLLRFFKFLLRDFSLPKFKKWDEMNDLQKAGRFALGSAVCILAAAAVLALWATLQMHLQHDSTALSFCGVGLIIGLVLYAGFNIVRALAYLVIHFKDRALAELHNSR